MQEIEERFVKNYIDKKYQERLLYELNSLKKRADALSRFSHGVEAILKKSVEQKVITNIDNLPNKQQAVYIISWDEKNGTTMPFDEAVRYLQSAYMAVILIGEAFSIVKEETEQGSARILYLQ